MATEILESSPAPASENGVGPGEAPAEQGWRQDRQGRWISGAKGRSGVVYRKGNETVDEAHARDARGEGARERTPKKPHTARKTPKAPAPTAEALKDLEWELAEALKAPSMIAGLAGDDWVAGHFYREGPTLARNLVKASEHNPWLRSKLEAMAGGGDDLLIRLIFAMSIGGSLIAYAVPPVLFYLDLPVLAPAKRTFQVPDRSELRAAARREQEAERAAEMAATETADSAEA